MITFDNTFDYIKLERIDSDDGRKYITPDGSHVSSVTTILDRTKSEKSKKGLDDWAKWVGKDEANLIKRQAANLGSIIHENLEKYFYNQEIVKKDNLIYKMAYTMSDIVINQGLSKLQKVYGVEINLHYLNLFSGTTDLIAHADDQIIICDFKNTRKMKREELLTDYKCQLIAYIMAHNEMYGTDIKKGRIMMIARPDDNKNCEYKEFDIEGIDFENHKDLWLSRLENFYG